MIVYQIHCSFSNRITSRSFVSISDSLCCTGAYVSLHHPHKERMTSTIWLHMSVLKQPQDHITMDWEFHHVCIFNQLAIFVSDEAHRGIRTHHYRRCTVLSEWMAWCCDRRLCAGLAWNHYLYFTRNTKTSTAPCCRHRKPTSLDAS